MVNSRKITILAADSSKLVTQLSLFFYTNCIMGSNGTPLACYTRGLRFADWMNIA